MQISPFQPKEKFSKMVIVFGKVMSQIFEERTNLKIPSENKPPLIIKVLFRLGLTILWIVFGTHSSVSNTSAGPNKGAGINETEYLCKIKIMQFGNLEIFHQS